MSFFNLIICLAYLHAVSCMRHGHGRQAGNMTEHGSCTTQQRTCNGRCAMAKFAKWPYVDERLILTGIHAQKYVLGTRQYRQLVFLCELGQCTYLNSTVLTLWRVDFALRACYARVCTDCALRVFTSHDGQNVRLSLFSESHPCENWLEITGSFMLQQR